MPYEFHSMSRAPLATAPARPKAATRRMAFTAALSAAVWSAGSSAGEPDAIRIAPERTEIPGEFRQDRERRHDLWPAGSSADEPMTIYITPERMEVFEESRREGERLSARLSEYGGKIGEMGVVGFCAAAVAAAGPQANPAAVGALAAGCGPAVSTAREFGKSVGGNLADFINRGRRNGLTDRFSSPPAPPPHGGSVMILGPGMEGGRF